MKRGLAQASEAVKSAVGKIGGKAEHISRGLQTASKNTRERVASAGGKAKSVLEKREKRRNL
jgi:hypothetical protein